MKLEKKRLEVLVDEAIAFLGPKFGLDKKLPPLKIKIGREVKTPWRNRGYGRAGADFAWKKRIITFYPRLTRREVIHAAGEEVGHWLHNNINPEVFRYISGISATSQFVYPIESFAHISGEVKCKRAALDYINVYSLLQLIGAYAGDLFAKEKGFKISEGKELNSAIDAVNFCVNAAMRIRLSGGWLLIRGEDIISYAPALNAMDCVLAQITAYSRLNKGEEPELHKLARLSLKRAKTYFNPLITALREKGERVKR